MQRMLVAVAVLVLSLAIASVALGGVYTYAGPKQWSAGQGAGSYYSPDWLANYFATYGSGYDKTVTFIDNKQYAWHNTVRNTKSVTETYSDYGMTDKGHCKAHVTGFWGSCSVR
ncbi:MAG TPA: hypothetical protein VJK66_00845 [Gaiellaceae bacterium]|nr:hypothetical protein [Gaiellaceae bacterium]